MKNKPFRKKTTCERTRVFSLSRSSNNQMIIIIKLILLQFSTMKTFANLCTHKRISQRFWATFWVRCRLTVASNVHSLQLLIWNDLPKGEIEERKRNVVLFTSLEMNWMFVRFSQRHLFAIHYWFSNINMMANFPLHPFLLPVQSIFDHIPKNHQINSFEL